MTDNSRQPKSDNQRDIEVKTEGGNFLFLYSTKDQKLEFHRRGLVYTVNLHDLIEFGRTSQRKVFRVVPTMGEGIVNGRDADAEIVRQEFE